MLEAEDRFGQGDQDERVQVEFVSANPTGPVTVASARHAAYGDSLSRILELAGNQVEREYYVNDAGSQVRKLGEAIQARARGEEPEEYGAAYVSVLAEQIPGAADDDPDEVARRAIELLPRGGGADAHALPRAHGPLLPRELGARIGCPRGGSRRPRRGLRVRGSAVAAHHRRRRRQGPGAAALRTGSSPTSPPTSLTTPTSWLTASTTGSTCWARTTTATSSASSPRGGASAATPPPTRW